MSISDIRTRGLNRTLGMVFAAVYVLVGLLGFAALLPTVGLTARTPARA
jgi:hypothetical protein